MMNQEKIQELVSRSQQDDKRAFALLVSEFQPLVFRLAFRLLCDEEEARDTRNICKSMVIPENVQSEKPPVNLALQNHL